MERQQEEEKKQNGKTSKEEERRRKEDEGEEEKEEKEEDIQPANTLLEISSSSLPSLIHTCYRTADLIHIFVLDRHSVRTVMVRKGTKALETASKIHHTWSALFISAEVFSFVEYERLGSIAAIRKEGKMRTEGKRYEVRDGDIVKFKLQPSQPLKK